MVVHRSVVVFLNFPLHFSNAVLNLYMELILCFTGPLHGIPYGLKDIISVPGYKTTWGSKSFKEQVIDVEAWVYQQ